MADGHLPDGKGEINNQPDGTAGQQNDLLIRYSQKVRDIQLSECT